MTELKHVILLNVKSLYKFFSVATTVEKTMERFLLVFLKAQLKYFKRKYLITGMRQKQE